MAERQKNTNPKKGFDDLGKKLGLVFLLVLAVLLVGTVSSPCSGPLDLFHLSDLAACNQFCVDLRDTGLWGKAAVVSGPWNAQVIYYDNCYDPQNPVMRSFFANQPGGIPENPAAVNIVCRPDGGLLGSYRPYFFSAACISPTPYCNLSSVAPADPWSPDLASFPNGFAYCADQSSGPACPQSFDCTAQSQHACGTVYEEPSCPAGCTCICRGSACSAESECFANACVPVSQTRKYVLNAQPFFQSIVARTNLKPPLAGPSPPLPSLAVWILMNHPPRGSKTFVQIENADISYEPNSWQFVYDSGNSFLNKVSQRYEFKVPALPTGTGSYYTKIEAHSDAANPQEFILRMDSGNQNLCATPNGLTGVTGAENAPKVRYDWQWSTSTSSFCDPNDPNGVYCDSYQFMLSLLHRLGEISQKLDSGDVDGAKALLKSRVQLMEDGLTPDFRLDLDYYLSNVALLDAPTNYQIVYKPLLLPGDRLKFSDDGEETDSVLIHRPGIYDLSITLSGNPENPYPPLDTSLENNTVIADLRRVSGSLQPNALYYLAFDADVGFEKRPGETAADRQGYGTDFSGESLNLTGKFVTKSLPGSSRTVAVTLNQSFGSIQTLNRGRLMSFDDAQNRLVWSPSDATPVLSQLVAGENAKNEFYYGLFENDKPLLHSNQPLDWTIAADSFTGQNHCVDRQYPDLPPLSQSCASENPAAMGLGLTLGENQNLFLQAVFFTPADKQYVLRPVCGKIVSPLEMASSSGTSSQSMNLNFTAVRQLTPKNLNDILNLMKTRSVCMVSSEEQGTAFYWIEEAVASMLSLPSQPQNPFGYASLVSNPAWVCAPSP